MKGRRPMTTTMTEGRKSALGRLRDPVRELPVFWGTFGNRADLERHLVGNGPVIGDTATLRAEDHQMVVFTEPGLSDSGVLPSRHGQEAEAEVDADVSEP